MPSLSLTPNTPGNLLLTAPYPLSAISQYNASDYGMSANNTAAVNTTAINNAITAANAAGGGIVLVPAGTFPVTTVLMKTNVCLRGAGHGAWASNSPTGFTLLSQAAGTVGPVISTAATTGQHNVYVQDLAVSAVNNLASNTGGILLTGCLNSRVDRCGVDNVASYGIKLLGGTGGASSGDAMYCTISGCVVTNLAANAIGYDVQPDQTGGSHPDGATLLDCMVNAAASCTAYRVGPGVSGGLGPDVTSILGCRSIACGTPLDLGSQTTFVDKCRFEVTTGTMTVTLRSASSACVISPSNEFATYGDPTKLTISDSGTSNYFGKTRTSTYGAGPPVGPQHGDIWIATQVDGSGTTWTFAYDATQTTYKWVFIGGAPLASGPQGSIVTSSTSYVDLTSGPSLSIVRGGDYQVRWGYRWANQGTFTSGYDALAVPNVGGTLGTATDDVVQAAFAGRDTSKFAKFTTVAASSTAKIQVKVSGASAQSTGFSDGWMEIVPVRVI